MMVVISLEIKISKHRTRNYMDKVLLMIKELQTINILINLEIKKRLELQRRLNLKKKAKNELTIFEEFKLEDCKNQSKGLKKKTCVCYRHGALYEFKQFMRNDAINNVSFEIRKNGQTEILEK